MSLVCANRAASSADTGAKANWATRRGECTQRRRTEQKGQTSMHRHHAQQIDRRFLSAPTGLSLHHADRRHTRTAIPNPPWDAVAQCCSRRRTRFAGVHACVGLGWGYAVCDRRCTPVWRVLSVCLYAPVCTVRFRTIRSKRTRGSLRAQQREQVGATRGIGGGGGRGQKTGQHTRKEEGAGSRREEQHTRSRTATSQRFEIAASRRHPRSGQRATPSTQQQHSQRVIGPDSGLCHACARDPAGAFNRDRGARLANGEAERNVWVAEREESPMVGAREGAAASTASHTRQGGGVIEREWRRRR